MAKTHITTKSGTKVTIEGTPEEVVALAKQFVEPGSIAPRRGVKASGGVNRPARQKPTPSNLVASLIDGGFFRKPKDLGSVKVALQEMGHIFPVTTLSPVMLRLVRRRELRRVKDKNRWLYRG
jgi:hypothetical protein